jgi:F0F1-type ATP synthase delta subunit
MNDYAAIVAKKYAQAFLNIVGADFSADDFKKICVLESFLKRHRAELFFLRSTAVDEQTKLVFLDRLLAPFGTHTKLEQLAAVLARHHRLFLLSMVVGYICSLYAQQHGIEHFIIASSHELSSQECVDIVQFLKGATQHAVVYEYTQDPCLIAGIRVHSDTLLWEYSVNKQLIQIAHSGAGN